MFMVPPIRLSSWNHFFCWNFTFLVFRILKRFKSQSGIISHYLFLATRVSLQFLKYIPEYYLKKKNYILDEDSYISHWANIKHKLINILSYWYMLLLRYNQIECLRAVEKDSSAELQFLKRVGLESITLKDCWREKLWG